jgi:hypothetical protein
MKVKSTKQNPHGKLRALALRLVNEPTKAFINLEEENYLQVAIHCFLCCAEQIARGVYRLSSDADGRIYTISTLTATCIDISYAEWSDDNIINLNLELDESFNIKTIGGNSLSVSFVIINGTHIVNNHKYTSGDTITCKVGINLIVDMLKNIYNR